MDKKKAVVVEEGYQVRQGDVLLNRLSDAEAAKFDKSKMKKVAEKRVTLAFGEVTGHSHTIECDAVAEFRDESGRRLLWVEHSAELKHQEHGHINIMPGWYVMPVQRQLSNDLIARRVLD